MKYILLMTIALSACVSAPNMETGEGCWRLGVAESGNTGRMTDTPINEIPVVKLSFDGLAEMCGARAYGCFKNDTIYLFRMNDERTLFEEQCHAFWGRNHNACYPNYGIGKDESDCDWNADHN